MHHQHRLRAPRAWAESSCPPAITPHGEEPQHSTMGMTTSARSDQSHQEATKKRPAWGHHLLAPTWPPLGNKQKQEEVEQAMASCRGLTHFLPLADKFLTTPKPPALSSACPSSAQAWQLLRWGQRTDLRREEMSLPTPSPRDGDHEEGSRGASRAAAHRAHQAKAASCWRCASPGWSHSTGPPRP